MIVIETQCAELTTYERPHSRIWKGNLLVGFGLGLTQILGTQMQAWAARLNETGAARSCMRRRIEI